MIVCPYFKNCGGCSLQNLEYKVQIDKKTELLSKLLSVDKDSIKVFYDKPFNYRNRMDFIFHKNGLGLRKKRDWKKIIDVEYCYIAENRINELLKEIMDFFKDLDYFDVENNSGTFRYAVVRVANESSISFVLNSNSARIRAAVERIREYSKISSAQNIVVTFVPENTDVSISDDFFVAKGNAKLSINLLNKIFHFSVQGFFQNNYSMAKKMHLYVNNLIMNETRIKTKELFLLDLYSGVGTFGIINSDFFKHVFLVENNKSCVESAIENIKINNAKNISVFNLDASKIKRLSVEKNNVYVIIDPPRSGIHPKALNAIKELKPKKIIYISCNPIELSKDIKKFNSYDLKSVAFFDFFPQTKHTEVVAEFEEK
ncbi:MAG: 23S rRNA (uracil(1939)-C(5))-methyltransferase RlmD [Candidatus Woesearchaeota archaeon]